MSTGYSIPKHWNPASTKLTGKDPQYSLETFLNHITTAIFKNTV
jgi:hypothetical protein